MNGLFKFIFITTSTVLATATIFFATLVIGHAVTGSWTVREWRKPASEPSAITREYQPELSAELLEITL